MPMQTGKSDLLTQLGSVGQQAFEKTKGNETKVGQSNLPAGIENGVAQLVSCGFVKIKEGKQNAGKYMFQAAGVVVQPTHHEGVQVKGQRTSIMEMMCETPGRTRVTVQDHMDWVLNQLRLLGVDTKKLTVDKLEAVCAALKQAKPYFLFRTWKGAKATTGKYAGKEPMVNHSWLGLAKGFSTATPDGVDASASEEPPSEEPEPETQDEGGGDEPPGDDGATAGEEFNEFSELELLAAAADAPGNAKEKLDAIAKVNAAALEAGISEDDINGADKWADVVEQIKALQPGTVEGDEGAVAEEPDAEEKPDPTKGDLFKAKILVGNKKRMEEVEILTVNQKARTVTVKSNTTKKPYVGKDGKAVAISWDDLEMPE